MKEKKRSQIDGNFFMESTLLLFAFVVFFLTSVYATDASKLPVLFLGVAMIIVLFSFLKLLYLRRKKAKEE